MRLIKYIVPKPSDAIQAMIDGLLEQDKRPGFEIDMYSFGHSIDGVCYGCAAVCAIQKIADVNLPPTVIEFADATADFLDFEKSDLNEFEDSIDAFRVGAPGRLFRYYGYEPGPTEFNAIACKWCLSTKNWKAELPLIQDYCNKLKAAGL